MEVGSPHGSASSSSSSHPVMLGARWWKYVFIGLVLASFSSLLIAFYPHHFKSALSFVGASGTSVWSDVGAQNRSSVQLLDRRQLISQEETVEGSVDKLSNETEIAELVEKVEKVTKDGDDYDDVALVGKDGDEVGELAQDGIEMEAGTLRQGEHEMGEEGDAARDGKTVEHTGVEKLLDRLEEDADGVATVEEDGRFNKTISTQEGVLETVVRVGGHSFDDEDGGALNADLEASMQEEGLGAQLMEGGLAVKEIKTESGGLSETSDSKEKEKVQSESDVTWLDKIMGQEQNHKVDAPGNHTIGQQKKNSPREKPLEDNAGYHQVEDVPRLIDREDNEYVISNPGKNRMKLQEDLTLISDIVIVIVAAALGGIVCGLLGQPVILGYLAAGMVVGPGGLHLVRELVQVETLAQFGVVFLLFVLGVEFNPSKMQGVHNVALGGGCLQIGIAMLLGGLLGSSVPQGVFIGAFLSMSSTAVVVKCLMDSKMGGTEHGQIMLGILILQDCALGLLLAVMPALAAKGSDAGTFVFALSREGMLLLAFCAAAWIFAKHFIPHFLRELVLLTKFNSELFLLGVIGVCLLLALISQSLGLSLEVGAFVGGLVLSGGTHTDRALHQIEPIRNVFAALFLASIGMVMHPVFLWQHSHILLASLGVVFFGKTCLFAIVVRCFGYTGKTSLSVGIALAQIGEFAFILLSRAQGLGLVSKKLYLLLMGTSALSLVLTPFAFKIVIRLMPAVQPAFRKATSKPAQNWQQAVGYEHAVAATAENIETAHQVVTGDLRSQPEVVGSLDIEDGRGNPSSPSRVVLRRHFHQILNGKWSEWKKELQESQRGDHRG